MADNCEFMVRFKSCPNINGKFSAVLDWKEKYNHFLNNNLNNLFNLNNNIMAYAIMFLKFRLCVCWIFQHPAFIFQPLQIGKRSRKCNSRNVFFLLFPWVRSRLWRRGQGTMLILPWILGLAVVFLHNRDEVTLRLVFISAPVFPPGIRHNSHRWTHEKH